MHAGPPCGTSSRAREIGTHMALTQSHCAPRLNQMVFSTLRGINTARIRAANELYTISGLVMTYCTNLSILCTVENPERSFAWVTQALCVPLQPAAASLLHIIFNHCCYGSKRKKDTKFLANDECFRPLATLCPSDHEHEPWGFDPKTGWATASEVEYPHQLCKATAS